MRPHALFLTLLEAWNTPKINSIARRVISANNGAREMDVGSIGGSEDGEHNGVVGLPEIFVIQANFMEYNLFNTPHQISVCQFLDIDRTGPHG